MKYIVMHETARSVEGLPSLQPVAPLLLCNFSTLLYVIIIISDNNSY